MTGRKHCAGCGCWRLAVDFSVQVRNKDGSVRRLTTRCRACLRQAEREVKARPEVRRDRREYQRIWCYGQRRKQGRPARSWQSRSAGDSEERVDNQPLRDAVLASGLTMGEIAKRIGWFKRGGGYVKPDESRVRRGLGLKESAPQSRITYANAVKIAQAADLDPWEVGL